MRLRKIGSALLIALLTSTVAPLMVNLPVISRSTQVLAETKDSRKQEADRLIGQGNKQLNTSQFKAALSSYQQALKIYQSIGDRKGEGHAFGGLGNAYHSLGDYKQAIQYHQQSLKIKRAIGDRQGEANSLGNLGLAYYEQGDYKQAIQYHQQHLKIARAIGHRQGEANSLGNLGLAYYEQGDYKQAIQYHQQHLKIARAIGHRQGEANSLGNLGLAYYSQGDYKQAIQYHQQSLEIKRAIGDRQGEANSLGNLGLAYYEQGDYKQAIQYHQQHLKIARAIGHRQGEGASLNNLGNTYLKWGQPKQAEKYLRDAIQVSESQRSLLGNNHAFKVSFFDTQASTYRLLQQALIAQNQNENALEIAESGRARAFTELIIEKQPSSSSPPPNIEQIRLAAKQQNATIVYYSIASDDLYIWVIKPNGKISFHQTDLKDKNLGNLTEDSRTAAATLAEGGSPQGSVANDAISSLVEQTRSSLSKIDNTSATSSPDKPRALGCRGNVCLQQTYDLLIQPIASQLPNNPQERVIFVPHESLFLVPFAALQNKQDKKFLIEKHTISIAPSIHVLQLTDEKKRQLNSQPSRKDKSMVVVGNPTMPKIVLNPGADAEQLDPLPGADKEAGEIAEIFNTKAITGDGATKAAVTQQMAEANYIHLATHGLLEDLDNKAKIPGTIALAPAAKDDDDGLLSANEVLKMKLQSDLVVLSACETGRGRITGDGVIGLPRAFISAGTPSIVVSLWRVSDESTAFMMPEFYRQLKKHNNDKAVALREAMLETMKKYPNPRDWSAFLLIGEND